MICVFNSTGIWMHAHSPDLRIELTAVSLVRTIEAIRGVVAHPGQWYTLSDSTATRELFCSAILVS